MTAVLEVSRPAPLAAGFRAAGFRDVLHSEWTKIRTIPSTFWTLLVALLVGIGISALISGLASHHYATGSAADRASWDPTSVSNSGLGLAQLAIGVLGIMVITSEYSTNAIRTSLAAVPRRNRFLAAKALVIAGIAFTIGEIMAFATFFIGQALISGHAPTASIGGTHVLRAVIGSGLYLTLIGLLGVALGSLLRSAAGAISSLVALLYVLPGIAAALPSGMRNTVEKFWPTQAGQQVTSVVRAAHTLPAWSGFGVMCGFVAIVTAAAFVQLERRDA